MHVPHSLLTIGAAATCWIVAGVCYETPRSADGDMEPHNALAIRRSAYGSLIARLMKDSLHNYWHAGCTDPAHDHGTRPAAAPTPAPAPSPSPAGRFAARQASQQPGGQAHGHGGDHVCGSGCDHAHQQASPTLSWVDRLGRSVSRMDHMRSVRNSPFAVAPTHRLFLSASADWRVHVAWQLDPGDAALYEIDHYVSLTRATSAESAKRKASELAQRTIQHALSPQAGPADALTGAGAAINLLNDDLRRGRTEPVKTEELLRDWRALMFCLNRHRELRQEADEEDWWNEIPDVRRTEIETYATMLERLSVMIQKQLASDGTIRQ